MENSAPRKVKKIVVLGGGSAGLIAAVAINKHLPDIDLTVVRSSKLGVIGVGEGTIPSVPHFLHKFLGIGKINFHQQVCPSIKLGIKYLWGKRPFFNYTFSPQIMKPHPKFRLHKGYYCEDDFSCADTVSALMNHDNVCFRRPNGEPNYNPNHAYHLENKKFVAFMEGISTARGVNKIDALVESVLQDENGITGLFLDNGQTIEGDLFIDCSGFGSLLLDKALKEPFVDYSKSLFCDSAIVGGWERESDDIYHPYTTAETMNNGWAWQIEHDEIVNRGYVYCSSFVSDDEAEAEFRKKNPKIKETRMLRFRAGVHRRSWVKNVVALGNANGFVEPIEATAIGMICDATLHFVNSLKATNSVMIEQQRTVFNRVATRHWTIIRDFLALHYKFNERIDTPFWRACHADVELGTAQEIVDYFRQVGPDFSILTNDLKQNFFTAEGYLAMLVGQGVPYQKNFEISLEEQDSWSDFRKVLSKQASNGIKMEEYLKYERTVGVQPNAYSKNKAIHMREKVNDVGMGYKMGELNWH